MQLLLKKSSKNQSHLVTTEEIRFPPSCLFLSIATGITPLTESSNIPTRTMHFVVNRIFLSVCLLTEGFITMVNTDFINVIDVVFAHFIALR